MYKRSRELKIDIESIILSNQAAAVGAVATAPKAASVLAWLKTNVSHVGTNPAGDGSNARVDGTARPFTEAMLKTVMGSVYTNSGEDLDVLMVPPAQKPVVSAFTGGAQKQVDVSTKKVISTFDVYVGDFFTVTVVTNRWMRSRDALLLNYDYWSVDWLRPIKQMPLATTGDAEKRLLIGEWTLVSKNEAANGLIADLS